MLAGYATLRSGASLWGGPGASPCPGALTLAAGAPLGGGGGGGFLVVSLVVLSSSMLLLLLLLLLLSMFVDEGDSNRDWGLGPLPSSVAASVASTARFEEDGGGDGDDDGSRDDDGGMILCEAEGCDVEHVEGVGEAGAIVV